MFSSRSLEVALERFFLAKYEFKSLVPFFCHQPVDVCKPKGNNGKNHAHTGKMGEFAQFSRDYQYGQ